jgi:tRNA uridine 5-carboxymethylaminomethyl modification enzyme
MFTSRAEYRVLLRQDNADIRLTPLAVELGMNYMEDRIKKVEDKVADAKKITRFLNDCSVEPEQINGLLEEKGSMPIKQKVKAQGIILRPNISIADVRGAVPGLNDFLSNYKAEAVEQAEINLKYAGYMAKEQEMVDKMSRLEMLKLSESFAYHSLTSLSAEARYQRFTHSSWSITFKINEYVSYFGSFTLWLQMGSFNNPHFSYHSGSRQIVRQSFFYRQG